MWKRGLPSQDLLGPASSILPQGTSTHGSQDPEPAMCTGTQGTCPHLRPLGVC